MNPKTVHLDPADPHVHLVTKAVILPAVVLCAIDTMEELQTRHKKEQRDLQSRVTQKKKQASKKTRKGVNDECDRLEAELKERQASELAALNGETPQSKYCIQVKA